MIARNNAILPFPPADDHSGKEGYFVELIAGEASIIDDAATVPFGVITEGFSDTGAADDSVGVLAGGLAGTVKVKLSGAVNVGDHLQLAADGTAVTDAEAGARVLVGQALEDGVADELIEAVVYKPVSFGA